MSAPDAALAARDRLVGPGARAWGLFAQFFRREATTRYLGSVTGLAWALVHPIALLAVYHFVFTSIFRATGFAGSSFLAFVAVALWPWLAAQEAIQRAAVSVPGYGGLIRKVAFPHEVVVYASVAATLALHFVGYVVVLAALRATGEPVHLIGIGPSGHNAGVALISASRAHGVTIQYNNEEERFSGIKHHAG